VLDQPTSFSNINLEPLVAEWAAVLTAVREPFKDGLSLEPGYGGRRVSVVQFPHKGKSKLKIAENSTKEANGAGGPNQLGGSTTAAQIQSTAEHGADVDFDTALATLPLGYTAGKATYWIHPDNLVELQVLLLQHMRIRSGQGKMLTASPTSPSPTMSRRSSLTWKSGFGTEEKGEETGLVIFDDLERFAKDQSATTIGEVEDRAGRITEKAAASVRWCADSEAVVTVGTAPLDSLESAFFMGTSNQKLITAKLKKKNIPALFDLTQPFPTQRRGSDLAAYTTESAETPARNWEEVRTWLYHHKEIRPLVQVRSKRTRFCSPMNNFSRGTWAVLDRDIKMEKAHIEEIVKTGTLTPPMESQESGTILAPPDDGSVEFPYAVLEVRWEGEEELSLIPALDNSHLVSRKILA
jgi:SPX domain protein involved in polyphosphate accumulation